MLMAKFIHVCHICNLSPFSFIVLVEGAGERNFKKINHDKYLQAAKKKQGRSVNSVNSLVQTLTVPAGFALQN